MDNKIEIWFYETEKGGRGATLDITEIKEISYCYIQTVTQNELLDILEHGNINKYFKNEIN